MTGYHQYQICIEACLRCAAVCNHCASESAKENHDGMMADCIQLDMECAAICMATAQLMSLGSKHIKEISKICAAICDACATECGKHENEHCQECAKICSECADQCEVVA